MFLYNIDIFKMMKKPLKFLFRRLFEEKRKNLLGSGIGL